MGLDSMRGSYGRCPPILLGALILVVFFCTFNWWSSSAQNYDLIKQLNDLSEQLKISSEQQESCARQRSAFENQIKSSEEETAQLRVKLEQQRTDNEEYKKQLMAKDDEIKSTLKSKDDCESSVTRCKTELESFKKLDISKDGVIASLRIEKERLISDVNKLKQETQTFEEKIKQIQTELLSLKQGQKPVEVKPATKETVKPEHPDESPKQQSLYTEYTPPEADVPERDDDNAAEMEDGVNNADNAAAKGEGEGNEEAQDETQDEYGQLPPDEEAVMKKPSADLHSPVNVK